MVFLVAKISKIYAKLDNHHHHHNQSQSEVLSSPLEAFRSVVSNSLNKLSLNFKPAGSEILTFSYIQQCFELISVINKAFAKLVVAIDYPISKWEAAFVEQHLNYSLSLLELLNSISSCLSSLGKARLSLSHALSLVEKSTASVPERLKAIQPLNLNEEFRKEENKDVKDKFFSNKEAVLHEALMIMQSLGFSFCGIVLSSLCGDSKPYSEMRRFIDGLAPLSICEVIVDKKIELKEVKELNDAVNCLVTAIVNGKIRDGEAKEELEKKLKVFEKVLDGFEKEVDHLFHEILAGRNQLLNGLRQRK